MTRISDISDVARTKLERDKKLLNNLVICGVL